MTPFWTDECPPAKRVAHNEVRHQSLGGDISILSSGAYLP